MFDWSEAIKGGCVAVWGLLGVFVGSWLTGRHQQMERHNARRREQLMEFYAPLRGMRADIKAKSDVRVKIHALGEALYPEKFVGSDDQLKNDIIPTYRKLLEHFMSHMGYAEESTISHYPAFVEFVEVWNRFLKDSLPREVAMKLSQAETNLYPLYDDIEMNAKRLSQELKNEVSVWRRLASRQLRRQAKAAKTAQ